MKASRIERDNSNNSLNKGRLGMTLLFSMCVAKFTVISLY